MKVIEHQESLRHHLIAFFNMYEWQKSETPDVAVGVVVDDYIKDQLSMEEGMKEYHDHLNKIYKYNDRILRAIKSVKGKTFYNHLIEYLRNAECSSCQRFEIVSKPIGKEQEASEYGRAIKREWVVQRAVGMSGDSWEGTICIQLKENKYLKFHFSM
jgi:hypothetical protein